MPRTDFDDVYDRFGNLVSRTERIVDDEAILREGAPTRLEQAYTALRQWSVDAQAAYDDWPTKTNAQKDNTQREVIRRFGILCDRLADLISRQR